MSANTISHPQELPLPALSEFAMSRLRETWGPDVATAMSVHAVMNDRETPALTEGLFVQFRGNHGNYLAGVAGQAEQTVRKPQSGMVVQRFGAGDRAFFGSKDDVIESPLDPTKLGLPQFEQGYGKKSVPLAVVIHDTPLGGEGKGAIELVLRDGTGNVSSRYLESMSAALDGHGRPGGGRWVYPGESELSLHKLEPVPAEAAGNNRRADRRSMMTITAAENPNRVGSTEARIIRATPTRAERLAAQHAGNTNKGVSMTVKLGAATLAGAAFSLLPLHGGVGKNEAITTAEQMVQPAGTSKVNGAEQAEQYFSAKTLDRSRRAFDAYFRGDTQALEELARANGFESNWIHAEAIDAVKSARNATELEDAMEFAFAGTHISFEVCDTDEAARLLDKRVSYTHKRTDDLGASRKMALAIIDLWNLMDRHYAQDTQPLRYFTVDSIDEKSSRGVDPAGYYSNAQGNETEDRIIVEVGAFLEDENNLVAHETAHYVDLNKTRSSGDSGRISAHNLWLNPAGYSYNGYDDYASGSTEYKDEHVTARLYGNAGSVEDTAVDAEGVLARNPYLRWQQSALGEKQSAIIFELEELQPGYTASMLLRTTTDKQWETTALFNSMLYYGEKGQSPVNTLTKLTLLAMAMSYGRNRYRKNTMLSYGISAHARNGRLIYSADKDSFVYSHQ